VGAGGRGIITVAAAPPLPLLHLHLALTHACLLLLLLLLAFLPHHSAAPTGLPRAPRAVHLTPIHHIPPVIPPSSSPLLALRVIHLHVCPNDGHATLSLLGRAFEGKGGLGCGAAFENIEACDADPGSAFAGVRGAGEASRAFCEE